MTHSTAAVVARPRAVLADLLPGELVRSVAAMPVGSVIIDAFGVSRLAAGPLPAAWAPAGRR